MNKTRSGRHSTRKSYVFFYGTLLPRLAPPEIEPTVRKLRRIGRGVIRGQLFDLGEYPAAILTRNGTPVKGEVFEIPDSPEILARLDEFEGFDRAQPESSAFIRKRRHAQLENGNKVFCWVYAYNGSLKAARPIPSGDYCLARAHGACLLSDG